MPKVHADKELTCLCFYCVRKTESKTEHEASNNLERLQTAAAMKGPACTVSNVCSPMGARGSSDMEQHSLQGLLCSL